jgi:restriction endonuclease S subunit
MGLKIIQLKLSTIALDSKLGLKDYSSINLDFEYVYLKNLLIGNNVKECIKSGRTPSRYNEDFWNGDYDFFTMQDINKYVYKLEEESIDKLTDYAIEKENNLYKAPSNSLIISNAMTIGLSFIAQREIYLNQNVFHINIDESKANLTYLKWYFNVYLKPKLQVLYASKYFSKEEAGLLKIHNIPISIQTDTANRIEKIELDIIEIVNAQKNELAIINEVFAEEFNYSTELWREFGKGMTAGTQKSNEKKTSIFKINFSELENSETFRFSSRFHRPEVKKIKDILNKFKLIKVKSFIKNNEVIHRGKQPINSENGYIPAIKTGQLKNSYIDLSNTDLVEVDFYNKYISSQIHQGDILMASTGKVSLGKVDLYCSYNQAVCDGHVSIIRIDNNKILSNYFIYYFRSILGAFQIERDYTGATNQIELYANEINTFDIIKISLEEQERIVKKIKHKIEEQQAFIIQIEAKKNDIEKIILETLTF